MVAASLIIAGFTGCSEGSRTTTTVENAKVNTIDANTYTAPVKGLVIDDAGSPVAGATVYIGSKSATTNAGGQYQINGVDVSSYLTNQTGSVAVAGDQSVPQEQLLTVSIVPPADSNLTSVVVQVNPEMVHIENLGEDQLGDGTLTTATTGNVYTQPNSESFTLFSEAGTAMLSYKTAKVTGIVRDATTGEIVTDTTIVVSYTGVSNATAPMVVSNNIVTGVNSIVSKTDENGSFLLEELLTSSNYQFIIEGYTAVGVTGTGINTGASALYADGNYVTNTGNIMVTEITSDDTISPYIDLQSNSELTPYLATAHPTDAGETMVVFAEGIDGTAGNEFLINFTEPLDTSKLVDDSLIVYDRTNSTEIAATVAFINNGQTLQLTTAAVAQDTTLEFRLRRSDFTDTQGNILHTANGAIDLSAGVTNSNITSEIQAALSNQFIVLNASTYKQVSMSLATVVSSGQNAGAAEDLTLDGYSNPALNTVSAYTNGTSTVLNQMNAADAVDADLLSLATALDGTIAAVNTNVATISFTADPNVTTYWARVVDADGADITGARITQVINSDTTAGGDTIVPTTPLATNNPLLTAAAGANASELQHENTIVTTFLVYLNQELTIGDSVEIYPVNDFGDTGAATVVGLADNTPLTTVINSDLVAGSSTVDFVAAGAPSSFGGDLVDFSVASGTALPYLFVRADMYKATDAALIADKNLQAELTGADDIYDAADYTSFLSAIPRTVAIQISEPVAPNTTLVTALKVYDNSNTEVADVITAAQSGKAGTKEVVGATISNIFNLQDYNTISLAGIADAAGNVATAQAGVKLYDALPPLMTAATVNDESVTFRFTEEISLTQTAAGITGLITLNGGASTYTFSTDANGDTTVSKNTPHTDFNNKSVPANTALETTVTNASGVLTITLTGNDSTGTATGSDLSTYFSDVHGIKDDAGVDNAIATGSSVASFDNVPDTSTSAAGVAGTNNSWANAADNLTIVPKFAVAETVAPRLLNTANAVNPLATAVAQQFVHAVNNAGGLFNVSTAGAVADGDWVPADAADTYTLELRFREDISDGTDFFGSGVTATASTTGYSIGAIAVSGTTGLTLVFNSTTTVVGDIITINGIQDASGNVVTVTATLEAADSGISINTAAIQ